ncbi:helix-turn-helix domain-containing protein [Sediminibacterium ginsengisoli]|uniref:Helix-turn-helix domain-containing protein n=1 Tax=Sediminibacterium ginsengisoli TaxID=413434 RepID=A0A1T4NGR8_9BACT|nr:helix-turn-helix transcriptional regulator [Sediminibacterium ginsengisoli]SJZ78256.1 Helix-turn-helix domain-containing protein [Sediminibacterium ginsengisoli]
MNKIRNEEVLRKFGLRIKQLRQERGMSQDDLAIACDVEKTQIYRIEGGKINTTISTLHALAEAFELSLEQLLHDV